MDKMNPDKKAWFVSALRSGTYHQGEGYMRTSVGWELPRYCVMGVVCDLYDRDVNPNGGPGGWRLRQERSQGGAQVFTYEHLSFGPPRIVMDAYGLSLPAVEHLMAMNDGGSSFEDIAGWVEENL